MKYPEEVKSKISVIKGLYRASKQGLFLGGGIRAGDIRRSNNYLDQILKITHDNEFINFSVSVRTSWDNDDMVDGGEFNSKINQFFEYIKSKDDLNKKQSDNNSEKLIKYTSLFWLFSRLFLLIRKHKIISIIIMVLGLLAINYSLAWSNLKSLIDILRK